MRPHFFFALHFAATALIAQSNLGSVEGKVVNSLTGAPVKKAVVNLRNANGQGAYGTTTDQFGKFHIDNVQPDKYSAIADAEGFANSRTLRTVKLFTVSASQQLTGVEIAVAPLSVISGKVVDENQEPLDGVNITVMRYTYNSGTKMLQVFSSSQTDDRGQYRIFDLQPGRYLLAATAQNRQVRQAMAQGNDRVHSMIPEEGYGTVIYPGVTEVSQATAHDLKPGEEWTGADFKLRRLPLFHVRGRLTSQPLPGGGRANVQIEKCDSSPALGGGFFPVMSRQDGAFDIAAVAGAYCLIVREPGRGGIALKQPVTIKDADVTDVTLTPPTSFSVKGSIVIDGTPPVNMPRLGINLRTEDNNQQQTSQISSDLTFQIDNIFPGKHILVPPTSPLLYAKSMAYGGEDVTGGVISNAQPGVALTIVLGTDPGEIDGTVQSGPLEAGFPVSVVAIPDDAHAARSDMMKFTSSTAEGTFVMKGLAPGDYRVFVLATPDFEDTRNRGLLKLLEGQSALVTVHPNGHEQTSVTPVAASDIERAKERLQ